MHVNLVSHLEDPHLRQPNPDTDTDTQTHEPLQTTNSNILRNFEILALVTWSIYLLNL
jgi:hypothetical protein